MIRIIVVVIIVVVIIDLEIGLFSLFRHVAFLFIELTLASVALACQAIDMLDLLIQLLLTRR